jgi:MoaA/NifB/PqqE/SkfB family radical SAM enzyme
MARGLGMRVGIATNGLAMTGVLRESLLANDGLSINFSLDSFFAEENDEVRGAGHHAACLGNLKALLGERAASGSAVEITLQTTVTVRNLGRLEESLAGLLEIGVDSILIDRMRSLREQPAAVRALATGPRQWIAAAGKVARTARRLGDPDRLRLNFGNVKLKAALAERYGYRQPLERSCPAGLEAAMIGFDGFLHPCRAVLQRPVPRRSGGDAWYAVEPVHVAARGARRFLESPYFVDFFNFAHAAEVYERLSMCRSCPHYTVCEPCPLDVMTHGERVLGECRALAAGCEF